MRLAMLAVVAGCGAKLSGGDTHNMIADASADSVDARPCAGGAEHMTAPDGSCFAKFTTPQTWTDAQTTCANISAHLAILNTAALDNAAEQFVGTLDTFIGLSDQAVEGTFVWVDGSPLGYSNWETGEPSNGGGTYQEDCAVIAGARAIKDWDDRPCAPVPMVGGGLYAVLCQY